MTLNSCPKRRTSHRTTNRRAGGTSTVPSTSSWCCSWRNPIVVFVVTFAILGTLRFRPRRIHNYNSLNSRSKLSIPFPKSSMHRQKQSAVMQKQTIEMQDPTGSSTPEPLITYELIEEGSYRGAGFRRYAAVSSTTVVSTDGSTSTDKNPETKQQRILFTQWARGLSKPENAVELSQLLQWRPTTKQKPDGSAVASYDAYFWETPPVLDDRPMEFVLVDAPQLQKFTADGADVSAFAQQFRNTQACHPNAVGCVFESLGKDALLIAPQPTSSGTDSAHLANFVRTAPDSQLAEFWKLVGETWSSRMLHKPQQDPLWLSTSGMGVAYLHIRLDTRPKYYTYGPYKEVPKENQKRSPGIPSSHQSSQSS